MNEQSNTAEQLAAARAELVAAWSQVAAARKLLNEAATYIMRRTERALYLELGNISTDAAEELLDRHTPAIVTRLRAAAEGE